MNEERSGLEEDLCDFCHTFVPVADVPSGFFMDPICQTCLDYRTKHYPERAPAVRRSAPSVATFDDGNSYAMRGNP